MNNAIKCLLLFTFSLCWIGCSKKVDTFPFLKNAGKTAAKLNGQPWESTSTGCSRYANTDFYGIIVDGPVSNGYNYSLQFQFIPFRPQQTTTKLHSLANMVQGHDYDMHRYDSAVANLILEADNAGIADYYLNQESEIPNYVTVDAYDSTTGHVTGSFQVTLYKHSEPRGAVEGQYLDTLRFTDGKFDLMIK